MRIAAHGLAVQSVEPVDARIYRRQEADGDLTHPVVHVCTVSMPDERGDYGSGAVDRLGAGDVFVSLVEFGPDEAGSPLFAQQGRPSVIDPAQFSMNGLQRVQQGQSGAQYFFTEVGRAFCLYVVLGSHANRRSLAAKATGMVRGLQIDGGDQPEPTPTKSAPGRARWHGSSHDN